MTPSEAAEPENFEKIVKIYQSLPNSFQKITYPPGTRVRLLLPRGKLGKLKPRWSNQIYTIKTNTYIPEIRRYKFDTKRLYDVDEILPISEATAEERPPTEIEPEKSPNPPTPSMRKKPLKPPLREKSQRVRRASNRYL